jgi:IS1 family transposase
MRPVAGTVILSESATDRKGWIRVANIMSTERRNSMLRLLVEGNSIRSVTRLMGTNIPSVLRQLRWAGDHCQNLMECEFRNLTLSHIECDEIWTFVRKKQGRLTVIEREERGDIGDMYLWTGIDQDTKLVAAHAVGKRSADMARRLMTALASRLTFPAPHASDAHAFRPGSHRIITQISTDGFAGYPEAVDLAFGPHVKYGTIIKDYRNATQSNPYTPAEIISTERRAVFRMDDSEKRSICTSHVERHNLTIRTFMKRFTRLSLGFSKKLENLQASVALFLAYYNYCWRPGKLRITPAMAAGITNRLWSFDDLMG